MSELITQVLDRQFKLYQDREDAHEEHEKWKEEREKKFREDNNNRNRINKASKKINRFDGSNPDQCLPWMEEIFTMVCNHRRNPREELLYNSGGSIQKTLYSLSPEAMEDKICDILLRNHSNLKTSSQCISAFQSIQQNPKSHYRHTMQGTSHFTSWHIKVLQLKVLGPKLAESIMPTLYMANSVTRQKGGSTRGYPETYKRHLRGPWTLNPGSSSSSTYIPGKSMRSTTLMSAVTIKNSRSKRLNMSKTQIIKVRIMIQITKKSKNNYNSKPNSTYNNKNSSNNDNNTSNRNFRNNNKGDYTELPSNIEVILKGLVNQDQQAKIKEILKNPRIYKDKLLKNQYPMSGEYAKSFNKFCPRKVEVNEAMVDDVICYGMHLKKSEPEIVEAIDILRPSAMTPIMDQRNRQLNLHKKKTNDYL